MGTLWGLFCDMYPYPFASLLSKVDGQVVALLVQNLERLDESVKEEADGVHNTLGEGKGSQHFLSLCLFGGLVLICLPPS